jgi:phage gp46-like protein
MMEECNVPIQGRRKIFWTTQPDACGVVSRCHSDCGSSGLRSFVPQGQKGRTFANNDYVRGLAINILLTDARKEDRPCGYKPGAIGGHWSDSYRDDRKGSGTNLRDLPLSYTVSESVKLIQAYMQSALQKLVGYGVAQSVAVAVKYAGSNVFQADIDIVSADGESSRVGITGSRIENSWVWGSN